MYESVCMKNGAYTYISRVSCEKNCTSVIDQACTNCIRCVLLYYLQNIFELQVEDQWTPNPRRLENILKSKKIIASDLNTTYNYLWIRLAMNCRIRAIIQHKSSKNSHLAINTIYTKRIKNGVIVGGGKSHLCMQ